MSKDATSDTTCENPSSYCVVLSGVSPHPLAPPVTQYPAVVTPESAAAPAYESFNRLCWMNFPYCAWNTVRSVTGNEKPILGLIALVASVFLYISATSSLSE